jgi:UDP-glucose 4-epimerase
MRIFISGAAGFIGGAIAAKAASSNMSAKAASSNMSAKAASSGVSATAASSDTVFGGVRRPQELGPRIKPVITGDLSETKFGLPDVDVVIHAAGLGHKRGVARAEWQNQNVDAAVNLARAARLAGAKRFVLISTAYVHGRVHKGMVGDETPPAPMDEYAQSKLDAEAAVVGAFGQGVTILRPVAVIGPGCPGNILLLMKALQRGTPLPFAGLDNKRGFIPADDLAALALLAAHSAVSPPVLLAAHPENISTPNLIRALAAGLGIAPRLFPFPSTLLDLGSQLLGRGAMWQSLSGSFEVAPRTAFALGWKPRQTLVESLMDTARYYATTTKAP